MNDHRKLIARLEALVDRDNQPDWKDVVRRAEAPAQAAGPVRGRKRSYLVRRLVPAFTLAAAIIAVGLIAPWQHGPGSSVVGRALAAIEDQPVLHVVFHDHITDSGGYVDLSSGQETPIIRTTEIWADRERGLERFKWSNEASGVFASAIIGETLVTPERTWTSTPQDLPGGQPALPKWMTGFFDNYRSALEDGTAEVAGTGMVDGHDATWIEWTNINADECPLGGVFGNGISTGCTERVAIDKASSLPLRVEFQRNKAQYVIEIASIETLPAGSGDFSQPKKIVPPETPAYKGLSLTLVFGTNTNQTSNQAAPSLRVASTDLSGAVEALPSALWAGKSVSSLALTGVSRATASSPDRNGGPAPIVQTGIELHYGDGQATALWSESPSPEAPSGSGVVIHEQKADPEIVFWPDPSHPAPAGSMVVIGGRGWLEKSGVYALIVAPNRDLLLAAARALEPIQTSAGTG
ncbi:MAG TPA: hypothetical protein VIJ84_07115 [Gaiellaceae bacterium]